MTATHLNRSQIRELLDSHGLSPSRALGQNFLCDGGMVDKIVRLADIEPGDRVVEIGAGLGSLTLGLCAAGASVLALEVDRYLIPPLTEQTAGCDVEIHNHDARTFDWETSLGRHDWKVVANLPYNIATPLVLDLLASQTRLRRFVVMVQQEAGERLSAGPGSRTYGIPSVLASYWASIRIVGTVKPDLFLPRPKVSSVLVELVRHDNQPTDVSYDRVRELVRAGFGQRRKMIRRSLASLVSAAELEGAGVDPTARAEQLDLGSWIALARVMP
ncbi:MAG: 16S rRNA (adenine(1518)-N(6)/adenine(1519)-N(6))-dimethyltransferase RsmA [Actinomycetia bacterium]|nr:16S rRNA (adenine(1518)-N(6)/adenine(1519)-N(6))-dimethyltransferase RsmA [Actinomycetes bacterium]MCP5030179.1 16S rRNA (adenine(1518)-N(6)/adenine(1519)-N(6))-dimethyltransferase RsmA [Actinomycetes bacterium]